MSSGNLLTNPLITQLIIGGLMRKLGVEEVTITGEDIDSLMGMGILALPSLADAEVPGVRLFCASEVRMQEISAQLDALRAHSTAETPH